MARRKGISGGKRSANELKRINVNPILKKQHSRKVSLEESFKGGLRLIDDLSKWYKTPLLSDLTVVYGEQGEKAFEGHRFVLCNNSDWSMNASSHWMSKEAQDRTITLKEDYPEALEALFEFCYTGNYSEIEPTGNDLLAWTKSMFIQHARVFVAADKYMAENLVELAFERFKLRVTCEVRNSECALF